MVEHPPLSQRQAATIGRVHHGMLYQHVFAARLVARGVRQPGFFDRLIVERDEDIEMVRGESRFYMQAKAHSELVFSELSDAVTRLHPIRTAHANGDRAGNCRLFFVLGGTLGSELQHRTGSKKSTLERKVAETAAREGLDVSAYLETWRQIEWLTPASTHADFPGLAFRESSSALLSDLTADLGQIPRLANSPLSAAYALTTAMHALAAGLRVSRKIVVPAGLALAVTGSPTIEAYRIVDSGESFSVQIPIPGLEVGDRILSTLCYLGTNTSGDAITFSLVKTDRAGGGSTPASDSSSTAGELNLRSRCRGLDLSPVGPGHCDILGALR